VKIERLFFAGALALAAATSIGETSIAAPAKTARPNAVSCTLIKTAAQLQAINSHLTATYCLVNDIDLSSIANFVPIGSQGVAFTGNFFGNNHVISNLTINSSAQRVGLFGEVDDGTLRDVKLVNVNIKAVAPGGGASVGGLVGGLFTVSGQAGIFNVSVGGKISCTGANFCEAGGIAGAVQSNIPISNSSSSADVTATGEAGGLVAFYNGIISDSFATGNVTCTLTGCNAGGLAAFGITGTITRSFATGSVLGGANSVAGGLVGAANGRVSQSFATGSVGGGNTAVVGGLIGVFDSSTIDQTYAAGSVQSPAGGLAGGLFGSSTGATITNSYWDTETTGQATSAGGGTGKTTAQLRAALPAGFVASTWAFNKALSFPFINDAGLDFASPLATLVLTNKIFTFLPISQLDRSQYKFKPAHSDQAALAAVYTILARAIGTADNVATLRAAKIDVPYWRDKTQTAVFSGLITTHATLGALVNLPGAITNASVIAPLRQQKLVILRGTYTTSSGGTATHWMLATLFTTNPNKTVSAVVADDPWTGWQVMIDPATKQVVSPSNFPLKNFKVNGYQTVTVH
jgi:hypothetical protein